MQLSKSAKKFFGKGVYEEGDRKRKTNPPPKKYKDLKNLPKIPFYEKIIDPTYLEIYRRDNNKTIMLPPKLTLDMENDPRLKYTPKRNRLPRLYPELDAYDKFVHIGQRKLFISEIQHLSTKLNSVDEPAIVVYAGSAASNKGWMEHLMFPNIKFLFVDPNMFKIYIQTYGDSHYLHAGEPGIIYYGNSKTNYNPDYEVSVKSINYFDGEKEFVVQDKYSDSAPLTNKIDEQDERYIKHFFESPHSIFINEKYFTNNTAKFVKKLFDERQHYPKYAGCKCIFWSDIRTNDMGGEDEFPSDLDLLWNSAMMYNWCKIAEPDHAMLKFRCPFMSDKNVDFDKYRTDFDIAKEFGNNIQKDFEENKLFTFFKGEIYHQAWCHRTSTETRLWVEKDDIVNNNIVKYDYIAFEEAIFYYNCIRRTSMYHENPYANKELRFDHCGDCSIEASVWKQYKTLDKNISVEFWINWLGEITTRPLGRAGHGYLFFSQPDRTYKEFLEFIGGKDKLTGKNAYYTKIVDIKYRDLYFKEDTPRVVHPPKLEFTSKDPKLNINSRNYFNEIEDPETLKLCKEMNKNRINNFFKRSILSEVWHLTEHLSKDEHAIVMYLGSAPGYGLKILSELFPNVKFLFIDTMAHFISITEHGDYHYQYYNTSNYDITYLSLNNTNFQYIKSNPNNLDFSIKLFDGTKEIKLQNRYKYLAETTLTESNIDKYYDYIYTSNNRFFIVEQTFDDSMATMLSMVKGQASKYSEYKDCKFIFWSDLLYIRENNIVSLSNMNYANYLRTYAMLYNWLRQIKPTYAKLLFRPSPQHEIVLWDTIHSQDLIKCKQQGNDIVEFNNTYHTLNFFKGKLMVSPCMTFLQEYTNLWIDGKDILNNTLIQYDPSSLINSVNYHNIIKRFTMLSENKHSNKTIGFDHCNDCAVEGYIWELYKSKIDKSINVTNMVTRLNKLTNGVLLDSIHGYMFPNNYKVDTKLYIETLVHRLIPQQYHKYIKKVDEPKLPKLALSDKSLEYYKLSDSKYNNFINIPSRKYILSHLDHLMINGTCSKYPHRMAFIIYVGCSTDSSFWLLTQLFANIRILCFDSKLLNISIGKHNNYHWQDYTNPLNNIVYMTINPDNVADEFDIHPVNYFDGDNIMSLMNKNYSGVLTSINDIEDANISTYADYIFTSDKRIFVFEEDLTEITALKLKRILDEKSRYLKGDSNSPNSDEYLLWTNHKNPSHVMNLVSILKVNYVKCIFDSTVKFDVKQFYDATPKPLPWCNRQYSEFALAFYVGVNKIVDANFDEHLNKAFYYNTIERVLYYTNPMMEKDIGFDCCGDCSLEARIIKTIKDQYNALNNFYKAEAWNVGILFKQICDISGVSMFERDGHGRLY
jgi:hypothetical protein